MLEEMPVERCGHELPRLRILRACDVARRGGLRCAGGGGKIVRIDLERELRSDLELEAAEQRDAGVAPG